MNTVRELIALLQALPQDKKSAEVRMEYDGGYHAIWGGVVDAAPDPRYTPGNAVVLKEED